MDSKKKCSVYCFRNRINNKLYIGSTINDPAKRFSQHLYTAQHEGSSKYYYPLYQAIRKYGIKNFDFFILHEEECSEKKIREIEADYIKKYNTVSPFGYNQTYDTQHPIHTKQVYKKVSQTKRNKAKRVVEIDTENNILQTFNSIVDCAEETGLDEKKIGSCCRGERKSTGGRFFMWLDNNNNLIIPQYDYKKYKGKEGTTQHQKTNKQVIKLDFETKEEIKVYDSIAQAARENECDPSGISKACRGKYSSCGGFKWKYKEKEEKEEKNN